MLFAIFPQLIRVYNPSKLHEAQFQTSVDNSAVIMPMNGLLHDIFFSWNCFNAVFYMLEIIVHCKKFVLLRWSLHKIYTYTYE